MEIQSVNVASGSGLVHTAVAIKTSGGHVRGWYLDNTTNSGATTYFQFYDATTANVTVGTTAAKMALAVPGGGCANITPSDVGIEFTTAITIAATTTYGGSTSPTAVTYNIFYD